MVKMDNVFGSHMKILEILSLLSDIKPVLRQGFYEKELPPIEAFCKNNNLFLVKSKFKVLLKDVDQTFSNKGEKVDAEDPRPGLFFVYISKDELKAHQAALFELQGEHIKLGACLGYPNCCCAFFSKHEPIRSRLDSNYELPVLENSPKEEYPFEMNIFRREQDCCLLSHFPCSLACAESLKLTKEYFRVLENHDASWASEWKKKLSGKVLVQGRALSFI